ncbi:hypothetical protein VNI00_005413 [Paramarasmius palmivorus]|uniref:Uncharacterized protein n=1 Tax=Paramarasmius palmivorus TaxID=297713 RepID=A0AAW0DEW5_9AGAR
MEAHKENVAPFLPKNDPTLLPSKRRPTYLAIQLPKRAFSYYTQPLSPPAFPPPPSPFPPTPFDVDTDAGFLLTEDTLHLVTPSTATTTTSIDIPEPRHPADAILNSILDDLKARRLTGDVIGHVLPVNTDVGAQNAVLRGVLRDLKAGRLAGDVIGRVDYPGL